MRRAVVMAAGMMLASAFQARAERCFQKNSTWYEKIPQNPKLDPNSAEYVARLAASRSTLGYCWKEWSVPIWQAKPDTPVVEVKWTRGSSGARERWQRFTDKGWNLVPIPLDARPAGYEAKLQGKYRDLHMVILSHDRRYTWDFFSAFKDPKTGAWSTGIVRRWDLENEDGVLQPYDEMGSCRVAPISLLHGLVTFDEVRRGHIDHALAYAIERGRGTVFRDGTAVPVYPTEQPWKGGFFGIRFQLDPDVDIDRLKLTKAGKVLARAMQECGMIYVENLRGASAVYPESLDDKPASWKGVPGRLAGIPMDRLRVVEPVRS